MQNNKISCVLILTSLICAVSCGETAPVETTANETTSTSEVTKNPYDELGEYDFKNEELVFDIRPMNANSFINSTIDVESENGDVLNDSIYKRNRAVEERFNMNIVQQSFEGDRKSAAVSSILAGDDSFDVFFLTDRVALTLAQDEMLIAYDNIKEIDLDKPYWSKTLNDSISIAGKHYFAYGDFQLIPYDYTHMLVFSKKIADDNGFESPYSLVLDGKWTIDAMASMMKTATVDLNGDANFDENDCFGYLAQSKQVLPGFWVGAGVESISKNSDDIPVCKLDTDSHFSDVIDKIFNVVRKSVVWYADYTIGNAETVNRDMFTNGKGLFLDSTFYHITKLRDTETDFGILPYPKWDEAQESYYSRVEGGDFAMIPVTNKKLEMTGVILEALSSESMKTVIPAYYEKVLKGKIARDDESSDMLDIIYSSRVYDLGDTFWNPKLRDGIFLEMFNNGENNLASAYASIKNSLADDINTTVEAFKKLS